MLPADYEQQSICTRHRVPWVAAPADHKVGIAWNVLDGLLPINGLRLRPESQTTGWYIWAGGEMSQDDDFFVPLHVAHLWQWCPQAVRFLGLPPGWRFLVAGDHEDVWQDESLLED